MGAYKKLNKQDVYVTSYEANKSYNIVGDDQFEEFDVDAFYTVSSSGDYFISPFDNSVGNSGTSFNRYLGFRSLFHLYYSNFTSQSAETGELAQSGSFDNFIMSSLATGSYKTGFRQLPNNANVFSLPRKHIGVGIKPNSFVMHISGATATDQYSGSYMADGYYETGSDGIEESDDDYVLAPSPEELLRLMSKYKKIDTNGSTLTFWASILAGSCVNFSDLNLKKSQEYFVRLRNF